MALACTNGVGLWVKGDANGGQIRFAIEDAKNRVFRTFDYGNTAYDSVDGEGRLTVDFNGWRYVDFPIGAEGWYTMSGDKKPPVPPFKLKAVVVSVNRERYGLTRFTSAPGVVRLKNVGSW